MNLIYGLRPFLKKRYIILPFFQIPTPHGARLMLLVKITTIVCASLLSEVSSTNGRKKHRPLFVYFYAEINKLSVYFSSTCWNLLGPFPIQPRGIPWVRTVIIYREDWSFLPNPTLSQVTTQGKAKLAASTPHRSSFPSKHSPVRSHSCPVFVQNLSEHICLSVSTICNSCLPAKTAGPWGTTNWACLVPLRRETSWGRME